MNISCIYHLNILYQLKDHYTLKLTKDVSKSLAILQQTSRTLYSSFKNILAVFAGEWGACS